jgi:hypothetical protein
MKDKSLLIIGILLIASIGNYFRFIDSGNIRSVEFVSILAMGILIGVLIGKVFSRAK